MEAILNRDMAWDKLSNDRDELLRSKLNEKESVMVDLYDLAEYLYDEDDNPDYGIGIISKAIDFIKDHCANE